MLNKVEGSSQTNRIRCEEFATGRPHELVQETERYLELGELEVGACARECPKDTAEKDERHEVIRQGGYCGGVAHGAIGFGVVA